MKLLLDHCIPGRFMHAMTGHEVATAASLHWDRLRNGSLLAAGAAAGFDAMITVDQNIKHQQILATLPIAVVVIRSRANDLDSLVAMAPLVLVALRSMTPKKLIEVGPA